MKIIHLRQSDYMVSRWSGGSTTQMAIFPADANYVDQNFDWRISSATVDQEASVFTPLPDYRRLIAPLRGKIRLQTAGGKVHRLHPFEIFAFDGGDETRSWGYCIDFNLMLRKGKVNGRMEAISMIAGQTRIINTCAPEHSSNRIMALFCVSGRVTLWADTQDVRLLSGESALFATNAQQLPRISCTSACDCMLAEMWHL